MGRDVGSLEGGADLEHLASACDEEGALTGSLSVWRAIFGSVSGMKLAATPGGGCTHTKPPRGHLKQASCAGRGWGMIPLSGTRSPSSAFSSAHIISKKASTSA